MRKYVPSLLIGAAVLSAVVTLIYAFCDTDNGNVRREELSSGPNKRRNRSIPLVSTPKVKPNGVTVAKKSDDEKHEPTVEEKLSEDIQAAMDSNDFGRLLDELKKAKDCRDPAVRMQLVDALGWYGEKALPELTEFLADHDEDVAERAATLWSASIDDVTNVAFRVKLIETGLQTVFNDNVIETLASSLESTDERLAIASLCRLSMTGTGKSQPRLRKVYEFITGEKWSGAAEARAWLAENYTPPDKD